MNLNHLITCRVAHGIKMAGAKRCRLFIFHCIIIISHHKQHHLLHCRSCIFCFCITTTTTAAAAAATAEAAENGRGSRHDITRFDRAIIHCINTTITITTTTTTTSKMTAPPSLEAKLVVLGSQGVGKTSLVHRYCKNTFIPPSKAQSTVGASFLTTRVHDSESGTTIRLQIWDTAGQERFRSISRLYYRGANAAILCYDVTSKKSFDDMGVWLRELRENCGEGAEDMILHIVGTKTDVVGKDPGAREVPFERCMGYIAEQLYPGGNAASSSAVATPGLGVGSPPMMTTYSSSPAGQHHYQLRPHAAAAASAGTINSPNSNRSSWWGQEAHLWNCCHEISAKDGEGIDEVFRVVTRKLIEQNAKRMEQQRLIEEYQSRTTPGGMDFGGGGGATTPGGGYFDLPNGGNGSFRLGGHGDKRRSWLGSLATPGGLTNYGGGEEEVDNTGGGKGRGKGRCC